MHLPLLHRGGRAYCRLAFLIMLMLAGAGSAFAQLSSYKFTASTGTATDMTGSTSISVSSSDDGYSPVVNIGFTFQFDGNNYSQFSVNTNGLMKLGSTAITNTRFNESFPGSAPGSTDYPFLAPFWDDLYLRPDGIRYKVTGSSPARVLTVEWHVEHYSGNSSEDLRMQVRLYETTNRIEIYYGTFTILSTLNEFTGFIGIGSTAGNYIGVAPGPPASTYTTGNAIVSPIPPAANTLYSFDCYNATIAGFTNDGGTSEMLDGDELLTSLLVDVGTSHVLHPFQTTVSGCASGTFTYTISGPNAADYQIAPSSVTLQSGQSSIPTLTFTPSSGGLRQATLKVSDGTTIIRSYPLKGRGSSIKFIGNIPEGGVADMSDGAILLEGRAVKRKQSQEFRPLTVKNIDPTLANPAVTVSYSITGISGGQYTVEPPSTSVGPGQSATPVITFRPTGIGTIEDELVVTTSEGIVMHYGLRGIAEAPAVLFKVNGTTIDSTSTLFTNQTGCVGAEVVSIPIEATNVGIGAVTITDVKVYLTDTVYRDGTPRYPLRRDGQGNPMLVADYFLTDYEVNPSYNNQSSLEAPIVIAQGATKTLYLNFVAAQPTKRFARVYIYTDGVSYGNSDTTGATIEGMLRLDVFGRGSGALLSDNVKGGLPKAVIFPQVAVGDSYDQPLRLVNVGTCSLHVSLKKLQVVSGDVDEFSIVGVPNKYIDSITGNLVLAPGEMDSIVVRFAPFRLGSRRAGLRLATNDSTIQIPGITERGVYYIDLFGGGRAGLYIDGFDFGQVLSDAPAGENGHGVVRVRNTTSTPLTILSLSIEGDDAAQFSQDGAAHPWPALPYMIQPGEELELGVVFAPTGAPGDRSAMLKVTAGNNIEVTADLTGMAGTRMMEVTPAAINFPGTTVGRYQRRMVTITNTGTMPMRVGQIEVTGADMANFQVGTLPQRDIEPGYSERVEVTFVPGAQGTPTATLVINGNATNAPGQVLLSGTAFKTKNPDDDDPSIPGRGVSDRDAVRNGLEHPEDGLSVSGVEMATSVAGVTLYQSVPNPARDVVEISYSLVKGADVELGLYDVSGRLVRVLESGSRQAGENSVRIAVGDLAVGTYHYRLTVDGHSLSRTLTIVK